MAEKTEKKNKWRKQYDDSKANLAKLKLDLANLYSIKDLANRDYQLKVLKEQYGMDLGAYHQKQVDKLNESKHILTSRYYVPSPNIGLGAQPLSYTSDVNASAEGIEMYSGKKITVNETKLNPHYDETLDLKSEYHVKKREKDGSTYDADFETQRQNEFTEAFHYGTASDTDAWGRDYDHPDYGIDPSSINREIVTPTPVGDNNNNNNNNDEVIEESSDNNANTSALNLSSSVNTNLGAKDGDLIAVNTNDNKGETPNRLELMTQSIKDNPSRIQKDLMGIKKAGDTPTTGWTPERLAGLKIKHQDWKAERRNRKNLQVEAKKA